jgi:hypothetical protein
MRRLGVAAVCVLLAPGLGALGACTSSEANSPAATSSPITRQAGAAGLTSSGGGAYGLVAGALLESLLKPGVEQGYDFLGDLLSGGDDTKGSEAELTHVQDQLNTITTRLDTIEADLQSIQAQLINQELSTRMTTMNSYHNDVLAVYRSYFLPIAAAAKQVSADKATIANGGAADLDAHKAVLANKTKDFHDAITSYKIFGILTDQHDSLYPKDPQPFSVLKLAGQSMESKGYVTSMDSERLHNLYLAYADQEALTATLILEYDRMFAGDTTGDAKQYQDFHAIEVANLATPIPHGQIKVGAQLYMVPEGEGGGPRTPTPWLPINPDGTQLGGNDPATIEGENPGWSLPTDPQLNALYIGTLKAPKPVNEADGGSARLGYMWEQGGDWDAGHLKGLWQQAWFWTNNKTQSNPMGCQPTYGGRVSRTYTLHSAGYMGRPDTIGLQPQPGRIPDRYDSGNDINLLTPTGCDNYIVSLYNNPTYAASVVLTRTVDASTEDFTAQRSTALQPAAS